MRLYFCNDNKSMNFEESSENYQDLKSLLYYDKHDNKDLLLDGDRLLSIIDHLEKNINLLLRDRSSEVTSINKVERKYNDEVLVLGRSEIDIRIVFLIDLIKLLRESKEIYVYLFPNVKESIKQLHSKLKMNASFLKELSSDEIKELLKYDLIENNDNILSISDKSKRIPFIL